MESNNMKAMRDALERIAAIPMPPPIEQAQSVAVEMREVAIAALAAPPRNCDVGTAEEQNKRFAYQFCRVGIEGCSRCELNTLKHRGNTCGIHWAQMPYEKGETK